MKKIIVGITGASGSVYGLKLLETLREVRAVETHLIISDAGRCVLEEEIGKNSFQQKWM